ncbi:dTDP-4-dehydrorhamnose 3,5-epimerase [Bacteriovorax sp. Seq25_V]|uniref:dTDP-4-dehydrorhamnose 3,5-epimerase n=1 Tax=Bacteriovorax sp. Seq25_V TaxID=1201288 RepID=UPI00038A2C57|nr:dTDP-4-dehydrorhamnose 3,5-epimerase [Bacteriovorax sp. Seq25_V]EQC43522.1 dTDP-4-dehydrorhamnose 3,5-epimerase [Bacteriovorax sp. Seq25_V]
MSFNETPIKDLVIFEPRIFQDERGYFFESYNLNTFKLAGLEYNFVQDNQSFSTYGTLRGLHLQRGEHAQAKLVRVTQGSVLDVAVDLREDSPTYLKHFSVELSAENGKQLMIPRGFAHGFVVLSESATFQYKVDNFYNQASEDGIAYNDSKLNIDWKVSETDIKLSAKDLKLGSLDDFCSRS